MNEPVNKQPMDETRDDVVVLDTPQDITHEMTSTQVKENPVLYPIQNSQRKIGRAHV